MKVFIIVAFLAAAALAAEETSNGKAKTFPSGLLYKSKMGSNFRRGRPAAVAPLFRRGRPEERLFGMSNLRWVSGSTKGTKTRSKQRQPSLFLTHFG